jgi:hypothetical protein
VFDAAGRGESSELFDHFVVEFARMVWPLVQGPTDSLTVMRPGNVACIVL